MITSSLSQVTPTPFQLSMDRLAKTSVVLLGFMIPLSTVGTHTALAFFMMAWLLAGQVRERTRMLWKHPVAQASLVLFLAFLVGMFYTQAAEKQAVASLGKVNKLLYIPFLIETLKDKKWRRYGVIAFLSAMGLTLVLGFAQELGLVEIGKKFTQGSVFRDHIYTSLLMSFSGFLVAHTTFNATKTAHRLLGIIALIAITYHVLFINQGRSGQIVFMALWGLLLVQRCHWRGRLMGLIVLTGVLSLAVFQPSSFQKRMSTIASVDGALLEKSTDNSVNERIQYAKEGLKLVGNHPFFGTGTGSFKGIYQEHAYEQNIAPTDNPHNEYINIAVQLGLVGLAVFFWFFWRLVSVSTRLPTLEKWIVQGVILSMLVGCLANSWLMDFTSGYWFIFMMALCFSALNDLGKKYDG